MKLKFRLENNKKTRKYLDKLTSMYIVGFWAHYGVREYKFTGRWGYDADRKEYIPLVYAYDDHNGTDDAYYLKRIDFVTSGEILLWTMNKSVAVKVAETFEEKYGVK